MGGALLGIAAVVFAWRIANNAMGESPGDQFSDEHMAAGCLIPLVGCLVGLASGGFAGRWIGRKLALRHGSQITGGEVR